MTLSKNEQIVQDLQDIFVSPVKKLGTVRNIEIKRVNSSGNAEIKVFKTLGVNMGDMINDISAILKNDKIKVFSVSQMGDMIAVFQIVLN